MTVQMRAIEHGLAISGELDMAAVPDFRQFAAMVLDGEQEVLLDIAELDFIDTSGINAILRLAETSPQGLVLRWPRDNVMRVLDNLGIQQIQGVRVERR